MQRTLLAAARPEAKSWALDKSVAEPRTDPLPEGDKGLRSGLTERSLSRFTFVRHHPIFGWVDVLEFFHMSTKAVEIFSKSVLFPYYKRKYAIFLQKLEGLVAHQEQDLLQQIARNASSQFGRDHGFDKIRRLSEFRRNVPIREYEDLKPYFERVSAGDSSALFSDDETILTYGCTSGTTGDPKILLTCSRVFGPRIT